MPQHTADLYGVRMVEFDKFLASADYISVHTSSTDETRHIIDAAALRQMKPTAFMVNTSRGAVVDGEALADALAAGEIEAAGLDVTEVEAVSSEDPLLGFDNGIVTPHLAGFLPVFLEECPIWQADNIILALTGRAPHGLANPEKIKTIAVQRASGGGRWAGVPDFSTALTL